jgi:glucose/arabinose dehydrogenase
VSVLVCKKYFSFFCISFLTTFIYAEYWSDSAIRNRTAPAAPYSAVPFLSNYKFDGIIALFPCPQQTDKLLIGELSGKVSIVGHGGQQLLWRYPGGKMKGDKWVSDVTLYSVALDPSFPQKPYLYLAYNHISDKINKVFRLTFKNTETFELDLDSELQIISWNSGGHCGCELRFGPKDGFLYVSTGDGGAPGDLDNIGQTVDNLLGSILRLDLSQTSKEKPYAIPADNPFIDLPEVRPEIWSYGLRNPFRMSFDPLSGELLIGDNGDQSWEYVFKTHKGANHGWSVFEGSHPFKSGLSIGGPTKEITFPIIERSHVDTRSVIGGFVYQGEMHSALKNHYLFADYVTGLVWAAKWDGSSVSSQEILTNTGGRPICFGYDSSGNILIGSVDGQIWRLQKSEQKAGVLAYPTRLSETGLFASTADEKLTDGVIPYHINAPAWRDGALVEKYLALPSGSSLSVRGNTNWEIPDGAVLFQTLKLPIQTESGEILKKIETQLIHREGLMYNFRTFKWNEQQTDAELVPNSGAMADIKLSKEKSLNWQFQPTNQCLTCHSSLTPSFTIGFDTAQLNVGKQFQNWQERKITRGLNMNQTLPSLANPYDQTLPVTDRARAYLHTNCAHCHQQGGIGGRAKFSLIHKLTDSETLMIGEAPIVPLFSGPEGLLIKVGDPQKSEIYRRLSIRGGGQMPLFGTVVEDSDGAKLIFEWIQQMNSK